MYKDNYENCKLVRKEMKKSFGSILRRTDF